MLGRTWMKWLAALAAAITLSAGPPEGNMVVILLGPPGSGKTTQARFLSRTYRIPSISAAELLRKSHGKRDRFSRTAAPQIESGELVSDQTVNQLVELRIQKSDARRGFILDGYPTTRAQAGFLAAQLKQRGLPEPVVIHLEVTDAVVKERMALRRRADDKPAAIERRLADYHREKDFLLGYYDEGRLLRVDGAGNEQEVSRQIGVRLAGRR